MRASNAGVGAILVLAALAAATASCRAPHSAVAARPQGPTGGLLYLTLDPLPAEAGLTVALDGIAAVDEGGAEVPLAGPRTWPSRPGEPTLAASVRLPAGTYAGLRVRIAKATRQTEEGPVVLEIPSDPITAPVTLPLPSGTGAAIRLSMGVGLAVSRDLSPAVRAWLPPKIPTDVLGVVSSCGTDALLLLDAGNGTIHAVLPVHGRPGGIALDPLRHRAYVALPEEDAVAVLDLKETRQLERIALSGGDRPAEVALSPDGRTLLVVNTGSETVGFLDPGTLLERARVRVATRPRSIVLDPAGRTAYVFSPDANAVSLVSVSSASAAGRLTLEGAPFRGAFDRQGKRLFVVHETAPYLTVLDASTLMAERQVQVGPGARALAVDPRSDRVYLARQGARGVDVLDPLSFSPIDLIPTDEVPSYLVVDGRESRLGMVLPRSAQVRLVSVIDRRERVRAEVGPEPCWLEMAGER